MFSVQTWRFGSTKAVTSTGACATVAEAVALASSLFGVAEADFDEPFLPLPVGGFASDAYDGEQDLVVVLDGDYVAAHARLQPRR